MLRGEHAAAVLRRRPPGKRLARDPLLEAELDYCGPRGLAHSVFKSWDPLDQAKALAWSARQGQRCPSGHPPEASDPAYVGELDGMALTSKLCRMCEQAERGEERYQDAREPGEFQVWRPAPTPE